MTQPDDINNWEKDKQERRGGAVCQKCIYWEPDFLQAERQLVMDKESIWSDVLGFCHRHAPQPSMSMIHHMLQLIGESTWALNSIANIENDESQDYRPECRDVFEVHEWPLTNANAWCGEFKAGRKVPDAAKPPSA